MAKKRSGKLISAKAKARRQGWAKWIRSEADERAILEGYYFDLERAEHVEGWGHKYLTLQEGEWYGQPFELMTWQREDLFFPLFGWVHDSSEWGRTVRRYRRAYVQCPKKTGKSPTGSYIGLYMLAGDGERGAKVYSAATDKDQAGLVHGHAIDMVDASDRLAEVLRVNRTTRCIHYDETKSFYRVLAHVPRRNEGLNAHAIIADELHAWYGRGLFDALKWAFSSRAEPLFFMITTAGDDTSSICYEQYEYAKRILRGEVFDAAYFALIYEAGPDDDPHSEATWRKANPSLGVTVKLSDFRSDYREAKAQPQLWDSWRRYRLNIWLSSTHAWLDVNLWDRGQDRRKKRRKRVDCFEDYSEADLARRQCWAGLDLAMTTDLSALAAVFPSDPGAEVDRQIFHTLFRVWLPEQSAERWADQVPYFRWAEEGWISLTPGSEADFDAIREEIRQVSEQYDLRQLLYDPVYASYLTQRLELEDGIERVEFRQTIMHFAEPMAMTERLIRAGRLRHNGNPLATWCLGNTTVYEDNNQNLRPVKPRRNDHRRIDVTVAKVMGLAGAMRGESARNDYYEDHDPEFI